MFIVSIQLTVVPSTSLSLPLPPAAVHLTLPLAAAAGIPQNGLFSLRSSTFINEIRTVAERQR